MSRRPLIAPEAAEPFDAMTRPPVSLAPTITVVQAPPSPEPVEEGPRPASPVPPSPASAPPTKQRKTAGHKVGFESSWAIERPWVFCAEEDGVEVLMCKLCTTYKQVGVGQRCWIDYGSRTLRKDVLLLHEKSMQHRDAVRAAMSHKRELADGLASMESESQAATEDTLKVLYFILRQTCRCGLSRAVGGPRRISTPQSECREECCTHQREDSARTVEVVVGGGQHYDNRFRQAVTRLQCDGQ